ncbi:MAG: ammonia-forming cytochrome c nitrite reductase subunit c552 [Geobacteraceae bacterium]|nr:ammonia-forming cytochrome c nitrite reductase subunit c552 [Geobacteraceae bacterium]
MTIKTGMKRFIPCFVIFIAALLKSGSCTDAAVTGEMTASRPAEAAFAGSKSCRECHERFYKLWSGSFHGLAMQPYYRGFGEGKIKPQQTAIKIGENSYRADLQLDAVVEKGPDGDRSYPIAHVMGGKYVYYFLTAMDKGRLQTLPVAYDLRRNEWFDTALSAVRHIPGRRETSTPNSWKDVSYTFNTACRDCHVSQRASSFDSDTDTFSTSWKEPGINCETCHGPSEEHNRVLRALPKGEKPLDYKLVRTKLFKPAQHNDSCNSCHAKAAHLTSGYKAPERFFDHFDLATLEDSDYYPDGRDLGENYTMTSWMLSPCAKQGQLHCVTCHTSSGRYRFRKPEDANKACLPCHEKHVNQPFPHTRHKTGSAGSHCVSCHMPTTEFARMKRSDHSMLPPMPSATIRFNSPNACNGCHVDRSAEWADKTVRSWRARDYQAPYLKRAALIDRARKKDWSSLDEILAYIGNSSRDEIFSASLIRLLEDADFKRTTPTLLSALKDPSPLVRGAAADILGRNPAPEVLQALSLATGDEYRLVRVMAAGSLSTYPQYEPQKESAAQVEKATAEYLEVLASRPVSWIARYNLGNYYLNRSQPQKALEEYQRALKLSGSAVMPRVNSAIAQVQLGRKDEAEESLTQAVTLSPEQPVAHYNLAMLAGERGDLPKAEKHLRIASSIDPGMSDAAFRLCLLMSGDRVNEGITWCRKAAETSPDEPVYAYTMAVSQSRAGDFDAAIGTLAALIERIPSFAQAYLLQGELYQMSGNDELALLVYHRMTEIFAIGEQYRKIARERIEALRPSGTPSPETNR